MKWRDRPLSLLLAIGLLAAVYYGAARLSLSLALIDDVVTPLWPPTGIALVALLMLGYRVWPGVALGAFLVNLGTVPSPLAAATIAAGNTLAPLIAAGLLKAAGFRGELDRMRDVLALVLLGGLGAMTVSATFGANTLVRFGEVTPGAFVPTWLVWWVGDATGVLIFAPLLLSVRIRPGTWSWKRWTEALLLLVLLVSVSVLVLARNLDMLYLVFPLLTWAALRFVTAGASLGALVVSSAAAWAAVHGLGPFADISLTDKMLRLQVFNASAALTALVLAVLTIERRKASQSLEQAALELEQRVQQRSEELATANQRLRGEVAQHMASERLLSERTAQLEEAQSLAHIGSWIWNIPSNEVSWSDELYRIFGLEPGSMSLTFDSFIQLIHPEDRDAVSDVIIQSYQTKEPFEYEHRIIRPDGSIRWLYGQGQVAGEDKPVRMFGIEQDVTERKQAELSMLARQAMETLLERERQIAETLQRSLLPDQFTEYPGVELARRYIPGAAGLEVGGDWYDVFPLRGGVLGVSIGDVVGRGLSAAASMGQLRIALRAYALEASSPSALVRRLNRLVMDMDEDQMATVVYGTLDPGTRTFTFVAAGHPPPLLIRRDGSASFLEGGRCAPLGVPDEAPEDSVAKIGEGSTILLYTDGLVERHRSSIEEGMSALKHVAEGHRGDLESLCDLVIGEMVGNLGSDDDIAVLAIRLTPISRGPLKLSLPARPEELVTIRRILGQWLEEVDAEPEEAADLVLACNEAAANVLEHAYGLEEGLVEVEAVCVEGEVRVTVRDFGRWRSPRGIDQGRGLPMMSALVDTVEVQHKVRGSEVHLKRRLGQPAAVGSPQPQERVFVDVEVRDRPEVEVVHLKGDIDLSNAQAVAAKLASAVDNQPLGLVVDLSDTSYLDSAGLRVLFQLAARLERHRQQLYLVVSEGSPIRRVLSLTDFEGSAPITATVEGAVARIKSALSSREDPYGSHR